MKRIGYDADSGRYYFRDADGSVWRGAEGVEFGEMVRGKLQTFEWNLILCMEPLLIVRSPCLSSS